MATDTPEMQAILQRIERLEAENRRLRRAALAVALAAVVALGMGQSQPSRTIEANRFVLVGTTGVKIAELAPDSALRFFDPDGRVTSMLSAEEYAIFGKTGQSIVRVGLTKAGLFFTDDHGKFVINLGESMGFPTLELHGADGKQSVELAARKGTDYLEFYGSSGDNRLRAESTDAGARLILSASEGKALVGMSALKDDAQLAVGDEKGFYAELGNTDLVTTATGEKHKTSAASLVLFGKNNKVLWRAP
jgi:hypothetical protein